MHEFSFFLVEHWLPVGIASIVFFLVGLMVAKFIWGRFSNRLSFAVEQNLNLASQWSSLGASQRDLFKKLRSRWQDDRDAWESKLAETEEALLTRDARISQLTQQLADDGKSIPVEIEVDDKLRQEVAKLRAELETRDAEIKELHAEAEFRQEVPESPEVMPLGLGGAMEGLGKDQEDTDSVLDRRVRDLEQDLIDTHDELHDVRTSYRKQVELVETLEARLIEQESEEKGQHISELEARLGFEEQRAKQAAQLLALASQRSREIGVFRSKLGEAKQENCELSADLKEALKLAEFEKEVISLRELAESREQELEEVRSKLSETETEVIDVRSDLERTESEVADVRDELVGKESEITNVRDELVEKESEVVEVRALLSQTESEVTALRKKLSDTESEVEILQGTVRESEVTISALQEDLAKAEEMDKRRLLIQAELNDACHEMYDVRQALLHRLDEIGLLEARLDELDTTEEEKEQLEATLHDTRHELSDLRMAFNEKNSQLDKQQAQMEELEAIIEDRGAEVSDLSTELRQKRDQLRLLKESLAEKEGELEALAFESNSFAKKFAAKEIFLNDQSRRIADLELALTERYQELNEVRTRFDNEAKSARYHAARADQVESELDRRKEAFEASDNRIATTEQALDEANAKLESLTEQLDDSSSTITQLEEQLRLLSREKEDTLRELERANSRVEELENATNERERRIIQFESDWKEAVSQSEELKRELDSLRVELDEFEKNNGTLQAENSDLNRQIEVGADRGEQLSRRVVELEQRIEQLEVEVEEAQVRREEARESISKLEASLSSSDERVLQLSRQIEEQDRELNEWKEQIEKLSGDLARREEAETQAIQAKEDLEQRLASAIAEADLLNSKQQGFESDTGKELDRLKSELNEKEKLADSLTAQREKGIAEIERLRQSVSKRGEAIRHLQSEVSSIMMQRADRDNEISMLKNKLRAVESELDAARSATEKASKSALTNSSTIKDLESSLQQSLSLEISSGDGMALDELSEPTAHHAPTPNLVEDNASETEAAPEMEGKGTGSDGDANDDPEILFDEHSAELNPEAKLAIDKVARKIRKGKERLVVSIIGFAGSEGTSDFAERLSAQRADIVRERLLTKGVSQSMLTVKGAGQDRRFTDARARRVELVLEAKAIAESVN